MNHQKSQYERSDSMRKWQKILCIIAIIATTIAATHTLKNDCCLCDSFRYHAPCLIDLDEGKILELDLYFPHETKVAELADEQPEMGTFSFVRLGNITGTKLTDSKIIEFGVPIADKTYNPALCKDCKKLLQAGYKGRYVLADLYDMEIKGLIPIAPNTTIDLRCYEITMVENTEKNEIAVTIQGTLNTNNAD